MTNADDPVVVMALEYEDATLHALYDLDHAPDNDAKLNACLRWADALAKMSALPPADRDRAWTYLTQRGRVPPGAWELIRAAMEIFAAHIPRRPKH